MLRWISYSGVVSIILLLSCAWWSRPPAPKQASGTKGRPILVGWLDEQQLMQRLPAYVQGKSSYEPDAEAVAALQQLTEGVEVLVFLGTWCPDSEREVPRFLKIMELVRNPSIRYRLLGLDRTKRDADGLAAKYEIQFVPTFVVLQNEREVGRIVEQAMVSLEDDLVEILTGKEK